MGKKQSLFERMKANPKGNWTIKDIETLCKQYELKLKPPRRGSHYVVFSKLVKGGLSIPSRRPIKPYYIGRLTRM